MREESSSASYYGAYFGNCTKTIRQVLCSSNFPRCESDVKGPFLSCKRVLLDTLSKCGEEIRPRFSEYWWLKWVVNLLPENNDPKTSNFKKRCFEPANFKTGVSEGRNHTIYQTSFSHKPCGIRPISLSITRACS